jgi:AraC-like DNA-binding protein
MQVFGIVGQAYEIYTLATTVDQLGVCADPVPGCAGLHLRWQPEYGAYDFAPPVVPSSVKLSLALNYSRKLGYSEFHTTRKFKEISGMQFRDYLRNRRLAFALREVRDSEKSLLDIAFDYGFSSHEAFTRAFKATYGITPGEYRKILSLLSFIQK